MLTIILLLTPYYVPGHGPSLSVHYLLTKGNQNLKPGALTPELALCPALGSD